MPVGVTHRGVLVLFRYFARDPHRPGHVRPRRHAPRSVRLNKLQRRGAGRFALAADRPAACLQGIEQHARLGGAHGKLRDADREAG